MTLLFATFAIVTVAIVFIAAFVKRIPFFIVVPILFLHAFAFTMTAPKYEGYSVSSEWIKDGKEALILSVYEAETEIYITAYFPDESLPRLVSFAKTEGNKDAAKKAKEKKNGVLKFGKKKGGGPAGEGRSWWTDDGDFQVIDLNQSKIRGK